MDVDLLSLEDASALLGVSAERVRQLVISGDLSGVRFGNAWAVPRSQVVARGRRPGRRGRPFGIVRAWAAIEAGDVDLDAAGRYRNRSRVMRCDLSRADFAHLASLDSAMISGVEAAIVHGVNLGSIADGSDLYLSERALESAPIALVSSPLGSAVLRLLPDEFEPPEALLVAGQRFAPAAAVALDLLESDDPRHWIAARELIAS